MTAAARRRLDAQPPSRRLDRRREAMKLRRERMNRPEDSVRRRVVVLAVTQISVLAVAAAGAVEPATAVVSLVLVPIGSWYAWRRRREKNVLLKILLAGGLMVALASFVEQARSATSVDDARVMLGSLFVWVQVLHSFDLPRRRDLAFSMAASVVLMAEAGSLSFDARFALLLIPYSVLCVLWLYESDRARAWEDTTEFEIRSAASEPTGLARLGSARSLAGAIGGAAMASLLVFMFTPHVPGARVLAPPFAVVNPVAIPSFTGGVSNPDAEGPDGAGGSGPVRGVGYPGFGSEIDLRVRGHLSDRLVMRVRAPQPAFWRGQAYDNFDGTTWTASSTRIDQYSRGADQAIEVGSPASTVPAKTVLQTFYVLNRQPNIVFAAANAREVFFPADRLAVDDYGSIRSPIMLEPDTIYSVVSDIPVTTPEMLRRAPALRPSPALDQYTQLPEDIPQRVVDLAHRITDGQPTEYDKVMAVQRWLQRNTRYNLDIPPDPPGVDSVDQFLFERREGFCEHISSAMAVLLRAAGIPTRLAVGFDSGSHNVLTGYYDVHESDAHAWVEVGYPRIGWVEYDPTHSVPPAAGGFGASFLAGELVSKVGKFLAWITPAPLKAFGGMVGHAVAAAAGAVARVWPLALVVGIVVLAFGLTRHRRRVRARAPTGAAAAFAVLAHTFERRGHERSADQTPREYVDELVAVDELARRSRADMDRVLAAYEQELFGAERPHEDVSLAALTAARRVAELSR